MKKPDGRDVQDLGKDAQTPAGTLLSHQIHLVLIAVVDLEFGRGARCLGNDLALTNTAGVCEELLLEIFCHPLLDDDIVGVML